MDEFITILSVGKPYSFTPEGQTAPMEGCSMYYLPSADLKPNEADGLLGYQPLKETMPVSFYDTARAHGIPCKAKVHYVMRIASGKQVLRIDGIDFTEGK